MRPEIPYQLLRPAQLLLVRRKGWLGWFIRRVTDSRVNHVTMITRADEPALTIGSEDARGVTILPLQTFFEDDAVTGLVLMDDDLDDAQRQKVLAWAVTHHGDHYDFLQLVGIYARHRLPWLTPDQMLLDSTDKMICSEYVTRARLEVGRDLRPEGVCTGMVDPGMIHASLALTVIWQWWAA